MLIKKILNEVYFKLDPVKASKRLGVKIGNNCRLLGVSGRTFGSEPYLIKMGDNVTITGGVQFINHDGGVWIFRGEEPNIDVFGEVVIGNNCFIGMNSILLPGTRIGDNSIVAAGSVVKGSFKSNSVIGGVPARIIKGVEEYKLKVFSQKMMIRDKSTHLKRKILEEEFKRKLT
jgi:acetyltransferase-like isoleucine patch superfamily enzyme